jgi:uncharacterized protein YndB with AHSA1/START domain
LVTAIEALLILGALDRALEAEIKRMPKSKSDDKPKANQNVRELTITRIFNASREQVFRAWTDPKLVAKWWGPRGDTNPVCELDVRPGGSIHIIMLAGKDLGDLEGQKWPMKGTFNEVIPPKRIVYTSWAIEDVSGNPQLESKVTVMFEELEGRTRMTLHVVVTKAGPGTEGPLSGMKIGWNQSIDKLGEMLEKSGINTR